MKPSRIALVLALSLLAAGCGGGGGSTSTDTETESAAGCGGGGGSTSTETETESTTTTTAGGKTAVRVFWLRDGKVWPVGRAVDTTGGVVSGTVAQLLVGPTDKEEKELDARTSIPDDVTRAEVDVDQCVATVKLSGTVPRPGVAQLVYTLTQFPTVESVVLDSREYTRASFENLTPAILVESPLAFEDVASPLRARGTANTFEATFDYELADSSGKVLAKHFVTATSGNGMRGTFEFKAPFTIASSGPGTLTVYEVSAANGKRIHPATIPLQLRAP